MITLQDLRPRDATVAAADVVRMAGLLSVIVTSVWLGVVGFALFSLVLLGLVVPRALGLRGPLDLTNGVVLLAAGWISAVDLYTAVGWLDLAVHLVANGVLAVLVHEFLAWVGALPSTAGATAPPDDRHDRPCDAGVRRPRLGIVVTTLAIGMLLAVLWEFGEWAGHTFIEDTITVGYEDTLGDLAAGGLGSLIGGLLLARARVS